MALPYRFPGIEPFTAGDEKVFFGREKDINFLTNSVLLNQFTVVTGNPRVGKSSLINAGLVPKLKKEIEKEKKKFIELRLQMGFSSGEEKESLLEKARIALKKNIEEISPLSDFLPFLDIETKESLWYLLKQLHFACLKNNIQPFFLLVLDQAEELLTYSYTSLQAFSEDLLKALSPNFPDKVRIAIESSDERILDSADYALISQPIPLNFLLSVSSDKLVLLVRMKDSLSKIMQNIYEVKPLTAEDAFNAIKGPPASKGKFITPPFEINDDAAREICNYFKTGSLEDPASHLEEFCIDQFSLQLVCHYIEKNILATGKHNFSKLDLGDINDIFISFYKDQLNSLNLDEETLNRVQTLLENKFIDEKDKRRLLVDKDTIIETYKIEEGLLQKVKDTMLLKKNYPSGKTPYYILSHEWLVNTILKVKKERNSTSAELDEYVDKTLRKVNEMISLNPKDYSLYQKKGDFYYLNGYHAKAVEFYNKAISIKKGDADLYRFRGDAQYALNDIQSSNESYQKALELEPDNLLANFYLAFNYDMLNRDDESILYYEKVIGLDPSFAYAYNNLGVVLEKKKDFKKAEEMYWEAIKADDRFYLSYYNIARIKHINNDLPEAIKYYQKTAELNPQYSNAFYYSGVLLYTIGKEDEALIDLNEYLQKNPNDAAALNAIGNIYYNRHKYPEALEHYENALKIDPGYSHAYYNIGLIAGNSGDFPKAIEYLRKTIELHPDNIEAMEKLALAYEEVKDYEKAIEQNKKVLYQDPKAFLALTNLGYISEATGDMGNAEKYFIEATTIPGNESAGNVDLGKFYIRNKMPEKSITALQNAVDKGNKDVLLMGQLAKNYKEQGDDEKYEKTLILMAETNPADLTAFKELEEYYKKKQRTDDLVKILKKHIENDEGNITLKLSLAKLLEVKNEHTDTENLYLSVVEQQPDSYFALLDLAEFYKKTGQTKKALEYFHKLSALPPKDNPAILAEIKNLQTQIEA